MHDVQFLVDCFSCIRYFETKRVHDASDQGKAFVLGCGENFVGYAPGMIVLVLYSTIATCAVRVWQTVFAGISSILTQNYIVATAESSGLKELQAVAVVAFVDAYCPTENCLCQYSKAM